MNARRDQALGFLEQFSALTRGVRALGVDPRKRSPIGATQAKFLRFIGQNPGTSQAELARATASDPTLTSRVVEALISRGWVKKRRSKTDKRQYVLALSAAGVRFRVKVEAGRQVLADQLANVLDDRDFEDFDRIAEKLLGAS